MSTKRIEGYVDQFSVQPHSLEPNENITFQDHKWLSGDVPATLVIHFGKSEPVYTQSEVVAMLREMEDAVECVDVGSYVFCGVPSDKLDAIAAKHGIVLDPA